MVYLDENVHPFYLDRANALGGIYRPRHPFDVNRTLRECRERRVRSLVLGPLPGIVPEPGYEDVSWVGELADQLVDLSLVGDATGQEGWPTFPKLRRLVAGHWAGDLNFSLFPELEELQLSEPKRQFEVFPSEAPSVKHLALSEYGGGDLSWLEPLSLKSLEVVNWRRLESLEGIGSQQLLEYLEVGLCPKLTDISALEGLDGLRQLMIEQCNRLEDTSVLGSLSGLRFLSLSENKRVESVASLVGLKKLETLFLVGASPIDLDPLKTLDSLRYVRFPYGRHFKKWRGELPENEDAREDHIEFMRAATHIDPESLREDG